MDSITIFMSTYNGEKYLKEQIDSILNQVNVNIRLIIRDDGSNDRTVSILQEYADKGEIVFLKGNNLGYGKSFLKLFKCVQIETKYYGFADQDDIWEPNKLEIAIHLLEKMQSSKGKLYFSDLKVVNQELENIGYKSFDNIKLTLGSSYVRQRIAGCTIVFDDILFKYAQRLDFTNYEYHISHEWVYVLCYALGGKVHYDKNAYILYRRHNNTVTSIGAGLLSRIKSELKPFDKKIRYEKSELSKIILDNYDNDITKSNKTFLKKVSSYRNNFLNYLCLLFDSDLDSGNFLFDLRCRLIIFLRLY